MKHEYLDNRTGASAFLTRVQRDGRVWNLARITVYPSYRGRGYGTRMLKRILADADREGVELRLYVCGGNGLTDEQLTAWYKRYGFTVRNALMMERLPKQPMKEQQNEHVNSRVQQHG